MTTRQIVGVCLFAFIFFGSIALGKYLGHRDRKRDRDGAITVRPRKAEGRTGFAYHSEDLEEMLRFLEEYQAEVERIAVGYHQRMTLEGPEAAQQWLEQQTGKRPSPPDRERR